jgi:hypothetical protein
MSATLMGATFYVPGLKQSDAFVLIALADHANDEGEHVYPGNERLAAKSRMTVRGVQLALARLQEAGLIQVVRHPHGGRGMAKEWRINSELVYAMAAGNGWANGAPRSRFSRERVNTVPERVNVGAVKGERASSQPSENHKEPASLKVQTENPRQPGESAGAYAARIAPMLAAHMSST